MYSTKRSECHQPTDHLLAPLHPGPHSYLSSMVIAEALTTLISMPSRVVVNRLGEVVRRSRVDMLLE